MRKRRLLGIIPASLNPGHSTKDTLGEENALGGSKSKAKVSEWLQQASQVWGVILFLLLRHCVLG